MFSISREDFFGVEKIKLQDPAGGYASVIPERGANLNELVLLHDGKLLPVIAGDASADDLKGHPVNFYRGAKLSPFPNRVSNGSYTFRNENHILHANDGLHALHGLLWNLPFRIIHEKVTERYAEVELIYDYISNQTGYPFSYSISIVYRFELSQLICYTSVRNTGNEALPIGDGWHPYFSFHEDIDSLLLKLPACKQLELKAGIPTGAYAESDGFSGEAALQDLVLDHCFELLAEDGIVETELIDSVHNLRLVIWQQCGLNGYQFIQVYTPQDRKSIAIEPMSCAPDAFNNKKGLIELEPDQEARFSFGIQLR